VIRFTNTSGDKLWKVSEMVYKRIVRSLHK
jgi:hypothetical protein